MYLYNKVGTQSSVLINQVSLFQGGAFKRGSTVNGGITEKSSMMFTLYNDTCRSWNFMV